MSKMREQLDQLIDVIDDAVDLPPEVEGAVNDLLDSFEEKNPPWWKSPFVGPDGRVSTSRTTSFLCNMLLLVMFAILGMTNGNVIDVPFFQNGLTVPEFPSAGAGVLAAIINGAYQFNKHTQAKNGNGS